MTPRISLSSWGEDLKNVSLDVCSDEGLYNMSCVHGDSVTGPASEHQASFMDAVLYVLGLFE